MKVTKYIDNDDYNTFLNSLRIILTDKDKDLKEIYEKMVLSELSNIRAEKYDSSENKVSTNDKIERNIINPNYVTLMDIWKEINKLEDSLDKIFKDENLTNDDKINNFVNIDQLLVVINKLHSHILNMNIIEKFDYIPNIYDKVFDIRYAQHKDDLNMVYDYYLTRFYHHKLSLLSKL